MIEQILTVRFFRTKAGHEPVRDFFCKKSQKTLRHEIEKAIARKSLL